MILDRLLRRDKPEQILYGTVTTVDAPNRRVRLQAQNGMELWAGYLCPLPIQRA